MQLTFYKKQPKSGGVLPVEIIKWWCKGGKLWITIFQKI